MEVIEATPEEYGQIFKAPANFFNTVNFSVLNISKCEKVYYLIFKDTKNRLGIILGLKEGKLYSPFSAPFGGFEFVRNDTSIEQIDSSLEVLQTWGRFHKYLGIKIVFPPMFYNKNLLSKVYNSLYRADYENVSLDVNYQFSTNKIDDNYTSIIWRNARKNLKRGLNAGIVFEKLGDNDGEIAYKIIAENREKRGFPLRMKWAQLSETIAFIPADFFIVKKETTIIASAIVFHVAEGIVQVIYWGDLPEFSGFKTMNFLSFELFKFYKNNGIKIVDIGPSTEDSIPNHGLCEYKESIGCDLSLKHGFYKKF